MGDPKKRRKKYAAPFQRWNKERIDEEKILLKEYGLKNKQEIWIMDAIAKKFKRQSRQLITLKSAQAEQEKKALLKKLHGLKLVPENAELGEILGITLKDILERRLQTVICRKGLAKSARQARQFITHRHIMVGSRKITMPSYLVSAQEEPTVRFTDVSSLASSEHPERVIIDRKPVEKKEDRGRPSRQYRRGQGRQDRGGRRVPQRRAPGRYGGAKKEAPKVQSKGGG